MKRIYKGNDAVFNLSLNSYPFDITLIESIEFEFYTTNRNIFIKKDKSDITESVLVLKWDELSKLPLGVLLYDYVLNGINKETQLTSEYYIVTGSSIEIETEEAVWGNIKGDINNLIDLISYIDNKASTYDDTEIKNKITILESTKLEELNLKTVNGESLVGSGDIKVSGGAYGFEIIDGNLILKTEDETVGNQFSIDEQGNLIYEIK